ncbi:PIN domain-containing protein [Ornithinimicrobium faecis]|uniref:PIN domain-containing protein n=1 Tax=Ornithinimicrobium faecis TaxID=2934158 RepID=UPI00211909F2|nr:PIN domain-containing protein [Ornithinimicrobium sp. HY1745]
MAESRGRSARPVAVLDANLLIPRALRDLLLSLADCKVFRPVWQQSILDELERNYPKVAVRHRGADREEAIKEVAQVQASMARAFPDASLASDEWVPLVEKMTCAENDRHVLAVAVAGGATRVVTENTKDFPAASVPEGIKVIRVDAFLCQLLTAAPETVLDAVQVMCDRYSRPTMTVAELAEKFATGHSAPRFGGRLRDAVEARS